MNKAALLIDFDNVMLTLPEQGYYYPIHEIVTGLVARAAEKAAAQDASLDFKASYAPGLDQRDADQLMVAGVVIRPSTAAKNASDTKLVFEAAELLFSKGYSLFYIVSGDVDYLDLAYALRDKGATCFLWPVSSVRLKDAFLKYPRKDFVVELLDLKPNPSVRTDQQRLFILCLQALVDSGRYLGGPKTAQEMLRGQGILDQGEVETLWAIATHEGVFPPARQVVIEGHDYGKRLRLRYEKPEILKMFRLVDAVLDKVWNRRGECRRSDIMAGLRDISGDPRDIEEILNLLTKCGYLDRMGEDYYALDSEDLRFGTLRAVYRIVSIIWAQTLEREASGWKGVGFAAILKEWPRHVRAGGQMNDAELDAAKRQAQKLVKRCEASGAIVLHKEPPVHYRIYWDHPAAMTVKENATVLFKLMREMSEGAGKVAEDALVERMKALAKSHKGTTPLFGTLHGECTFWLSVFAAGRHLTWRNHEVSLKSDSALVRHCLSQT